MPPLLLSSDFDPMQAAIIVIAVLAGFVKWLWESWQQKRVERPVTPPDPEQQRLREAAWRKQTGQSAPPPPLPPVAPPSAWGELRKAWTELQETAKQAQAPAHTRTPPPLSPPRQITRQQPSRQSPSARAPQLPPPPPPPPPSVLAPSVPAMETSPPTVISSRAVAPAGSILATLRHLRQDPALMRQAILMQEILSPPKALQSSGDFVT